jgi:RNA polymerase sigma factor (TIGR02999 family)
MHQHINALLGALNVGQRQAAADLVVLLYSELHSLASRYLQRERSDHTLQTTALVHEAYLRLTDQREVHWKNKEQFMGVAAQLMRRILVDYSRGHDAKKRGQGFERFSWKKQKRFQGKGPDVIAWMKLSPGWPNSIRSKPIWWSCVFSAA